jgi:cytochrome c-type biogenesis protein CcmH/NrfG
LNKEQVLVAAVALIAGLLIGYMFFSSKAEKLQMNAQLPVGAGSPTDYQARIVEAEKILAKDPKNLQAWIQLGNDYFDTDQAQKAISAYGKALEIQPDNPNVLTDQGIMHRKMGWYDKAIANFEKAQSLDPKHLQSLFNMGIVYSQDLKQNDKALAVLGKYLSMDSTSPTAQQIKAMMEQIKSGTMPPQGMTPGMK